jgi:hypothetical protein
MQRTSLLPAAKCEWRAAYKRAELIAARGAFDVSTGHPTAETLGLSRGHQSHGHTRTASRLLGRASYA